MTDWTQSVHILMYPNRCTKYFLYVHTFVYLCITCQCCAFLWKVFHSTVFRTNFSISHLNYYLSDCTDFMVFLIRIIVLPQRRENVNSISEQDTWIAEKGIGASFTDKEVSDLMDKFQGGAQTWAATIVSYWNGLNNTQNNKKK